ncbi:MAG: transcription-repair coupling factor, partial [Chloroflexia bacterium]
MFDLVAAANALARVGYRARPLVDGPGTFSRRGGILDVWSPSEPRPVRIELFGDEVESIRLFDPETQRSESAVQQVVIAPPVELPLSQAAEALAQLREVDLSALRSEVRGVWEEMMLDLEAGGGRPTYDGLAPYFPDGWAALLDHLPDDSLIAFDRLDRLRLAGDALHAQANETRVELERSNELPVGLRRPYHTLNELLAGTAQFQQIETADDAGAEPLFSPITGFGGAVERILARLRIWTAERRRVVLVTRQGDRLRHLLAERAIPTASTRARDVQPPAGAVTIIAGRLPEGWSSEQLNLSILGDGELWGYVEPRRASAPRRNRAPLFLADLQPGGFVVHVDHGIARYIGSVARGAPGAEREYLLLEYASGDKLYVPVDQVDRLSPYVGAGGSPALSRLGSADWARTKRRVKRAADELAKELLSLYAARQTSRGYSFAPDGSLQHEFESAFPYVETDDQLHAVEEVKADMEAPRPMDRLVCGDVGYGKTEVALRAAFKAVVDGKQAAVLVPTTVLALQHFDVQAQNGSLPIRVEMLSRLRSKKERDLVIEGMRSGQVDIVIGTHRLVQRDVGFKDLGLLIVDEEQRFGVKHKEMLKQLRTEVDVLTLTATPIPRTLQMALAGVRDMSVIETAPDDRLPIKTYVTVKSNSLIRESILRELDRGGQVFYVHNRVHDIARAAVELQHTMPEARIAIGHGQMEERQLENVMLSFIQHQHDVLLCTTIIESGLDIPNANTIIVDDAVNVGLSQLYQLRGRVGRGAHRAYAYLLYRPNSPISEDAQKRLDAISQATELGA